MREFLASGVGIVALVFTILGTAFTSIGLGLTIFLSPKVIGIPFLCVGVGFLTAGVVLGTIRRNAVRQRAQLLAEGVEVRGTIVELAQNRHVKRNRRHPWIVRYRYEVHGSEYHGRETMMDLPAGYAQGATVTVIYDPTRMEMSALAPQQVR